MEPVARVDLNIVARRRGALRRQFDVGRRPYRSETGPNSGRPARFREQARTDNRQPDCLLSRAPVAARLGVRRGRRSAASHAIEEPGEEDQQAPWAPNAALPPICAEHPDIRR